MGYLQTLKIVTPLAVVQCHRLILVIYLEVVKKDIEVVMKPLEWVLLPMATSMLQWLLVISYLVLIIMKVVVSKVVLVASSEDSLSKVEHLDL